MLLLLNKFYLRRTMRIIRTKNPSCGRNTTIF
jgi:hypothetical protein